MDVSPRNISENATSLSVAAESISQSLRLRQDAVSLIDQILIYLEYQEEPSITEEMKAQSNTGGRVELESKISNFKRALKTPLDLVGILELELRRTRARIEWGWANSFIPDRQDVELLKSDNYKHVLLSLYRMNEGFNSSGCSIPPTEDELFRALES